MHTDQSRVALGWENHVQPTGTDGLTDHALWHEIMPWIQIHPLLM